MNFSDVFSAVKDGAVVVTVNQRLARHFRSKLEQAYMADGVATWLSPTILSFDAWVLTLWQQRFNVNAAVFGGELEKTLLTPEQVLLLWEQVIGEAGGAELLNVSATAKAANTSRQLALQWHINGPAEFNEASDLAAFRVWHEGFQALLDINGWIDRAQLLGVVHEQLEQGAFESPKELVLLGFDVFTSSQKSLFQMVESNGGRVRQYNTYTKKGSVCVVAADDVKDESSLIAQWAREQLNKQPDLNIGVIVPDLQGQRNSLEKAFMKALYPSVTYAVDLPLNKPYNVSLGLPLFSYPPVQQALRLLRFFSQGKGLPLNELSLLFRSPFITAGHAEWGDRAQLERRMRQKGVLSCSIKQLARWLTPVPDKNIRCPVLFEAVNDVAEHLAVQPNRAKASDWVGCFRLLLKAIGLQGDRELSSLEYQVFQTWDDVLRTFSNMDAVQDMMTFEGAISSLSRLANDRVFQAETPETPVQIMGLMEAAGHTFDALWVCGLHDKVWPPSANPNPFLPICQQREQGLIQSSAELEYKQAVLQTAHWASAADTVVLSYPSADEKTDLQISPLLSDYVMRDRADLLQSELIDRVELRVSTGRLDASIDDAGPASPSGVVSKGGVSIIKDQSACPFKAFANKRLLASALEEPEPGIDASLRGSLVHRCLEGIWLNVKTQSALIAMSNEQLMLLVQRVVTDVMTKESERTIVLRGVFGELESARMCQLLMEWLLIDAAREPFEVIETELKQTLTLGRLDINTSIDRVDRLNDGSVAVIDYKTGAASVSSWFGDRPEEPQLPLYGVFGGQQVHSISFAQLKKGELKYMGVSDHADDFSALKSLDKVKASQGDWNAQMKNWKTVLTTIADEFMAGEARVDPTSKACDYCDLSSLCRINEHRAEVASC